MKSIHIKFWQRVRKTNTCWIWIGPVNVCGYGELSLGKRGTNTKAHRLSWELANGKIPKGLYVLHRCDNPPCVNPKHLFVGTQLDNMRDMYRKGRQSDVSGEKNPKAKLNKEKVELIKKLVSHTSHHHGLTHKEIAGKFGVCKGTIDLISRGVSWNA